MSLHELFAGLLHTLWPSFVRRQALAERVIPPNILPESTLIGRSRFDSARVSAGSLWLADHRERSE